MSHNNVSISKQELDNLNLKLEKATKECRDTRNMMQQILLIIETNPSEVGERIKEKIYKNYDK